jgi:sugar/nucleoside kinase (ribokinase family)
VFVKPHLDGAEQARLDTADFNELAGGTSRNLLTALEAALPNLDLVIVNEQIHNSLHAPAFRKDLAAVIGRHPGRFIVDSRYHADQYPGAILRMNDREAIRLQEGGSRPDRPSRDHVVAATEALFAKAGQPVFVSRGPDGVVVRDSSGLHEVPGRRIDGPIDIVGAGDSLLAGISVALARGLSPVCAAEFGVLVASVTVTRLRRCGTASPAEVLALLPT